MTECPIRGQDLRCCLSPARPLAVPSVALWLRHSLRSWAARRHAHTHLRLHLVLRNPHATQNDTSNGTHNAHATAATVHLPPAPRPPLFGSIAQVAKNISLAGALPHPTLTLCFLNCFYVITVLLC